jgi:cytochrome c553
MIYSHGTAFLSGKRLARALMCRVACSARLGLMVLIASASALADQDTSNPASLTYTCGGCHGIEQYKNAYPQYNVPKIGGQNTEYLISALKEYKAGERAHPTMRAQAGSFPDATIAVISAYLNSRPSQTPTAASEDHSYDATGAKLVEAKGCVACHGKDGNGVKLATGKTDPQYPVLAGQYASYIEIALKAYRTGTRKNLIMAGFAEKLTDAEIKALSHYFSAQPSTLSTLKGLD